MKIIGLFFVLAASGLAATPLEVTDCDGQIIVLNPMEKVVVILASSQALAEQTREFGRALYGWQGRNDFRVVVVVDLRKSLGTLFKSWTLGKMKADLDEEGERLLPWYRANHNFGQPRPDLCGVADFDGQVTEKLGWGKDDRQMKATIFGKSGDVVWSGVDLITPETLQVEVKKLMGEPVPTPVEARPKKSKLQLRKA